MDFQDIANLHQKLDNINDSIRASNPNNSSSSDGPILETSTKIILFPIILAALFVFSIVSIIGRIILLGLSGAGGSLLGLIFVGSGLFLKKIGVDLSGDYAFLIVLLFSGLIFLLFLLSIILLIVAIVKKKRRKKKAVYQKQHINKNYGVNGTPNYTPLTPHKKPNESSIELSKEQYAEYCKTLDDKVIEIMNEKRNKK